MINALIFRLRINSHPCAYINIASMCGWLLTLNDSFPPTVLVSFDLIHEYSVPPCYLHAVSDEVQRSRVLPSLPMYRNIYLLTTDHPREGPVVQAHFLDPLSKTCSQPRRLFVPRLRLIHFPCAVQVPLHCYCSRVA